ncbi:hypothetical protein AAVH_18318 [Aphelenchoides avenae]|nr:hypothetical protein AAVH_18318 [Aphelenchus avenae]
MLPNESLLQVLHFADYKTLVCAKLTVRRFLRLVTKFAEELARRRGIWVVFFANWITYNDETIGSGGRILYEPGKKTSLAAAYRDLAGAIGPHAVVSLTFYHDTWNMPGVDVIFEAALALKYAEDVTFKSLDDSTNLGDSEAFMRNFAGMKSLCLSLYYDAFRQYNWTFLRQESARELRLIKVSVHPPPPSEDLNPLV